MATSELNPNEMGISHAPEAARSFGEFVDTIAALRRPDGCPWDREQTHASIASNMLEEAYEAVDTIEANDTEHLCEELGDVLWYVTLMAELMNVPLEYIMQANIEKLERRYPDGFSPAASVNREEHNGKM